MFGWGIVNSNTIYSNYDGRSGDSGRSLEISPLLPAPVLHDPMIVDALAMCKIAFLYLFYRIGRLFALH